MAENKFNKIDGTIFDKPVKSGKTKAGKDYSIPQLVLEMDGSYTDKDGKYISKTSFACFDLGKTANQILDSFSVKDLVTVSYVHKGKKFPRKDGTLGFDNAMLATRIEYADLDANHSTHTGKVTVDPFVKALPNDVPEEGDEPDDDQLPF
jgi:hypothetical protein